MSRYNHFSKKNCAVYTPYAMLGYPTKESSLKAIDVLIENGVDGLELGLPFRDPMADGPVIEKAGNVALDNGFDVEWALSAIREIRSKASDLPVTLMCYYNMLVARGAEKFIRDFAEAGIDGLLVPDLPVDFADEILPYAQKYNVKLVFIASPLTSVERLEMFRERSGGFVYLVTKLGITGVSEGYADNLAELFDNLHEHTGLPAIAGFGISEPDQAEYMIEKGAQGVITGSRLVQLIGQDFDGGKLDFPSVKEHTVKMVRAVSHA